LLQLEHRNGQFGPCKTIDPFRDAQNSAGAVYASLNRPHNADPSGARRLPAPKNVKRALNSGIF
jgi:hypothetical protein